MNKLQTLAVAVASTLSLALPALAADKHHDHHRAQAKPAATGAELAEGEVRRIDKEAGKLTIRHGEIRSIDMPPMTAIIPSATFSGRPSPVFGPGAGLCS